MLGDGIRVIVDQGFDAGAVARLIVTLETAKSIPIPSGARVWLATGHTGMRKGFDVWRCPSAMRTTGTFLCSAVGAAGSCRSSRRWRLQNWQQTGADHGRCVLGARPAQVLRAGRYHGQGARSQRSSASMRSLISSATAIAMATARVG